MNAFNITWRAHWAYDRGHSLGDPIPPKIAEAIELFEMEKRAKEALTMQASKEKAEREKRSTASGKRVIARGK